VSGRASELTQGRDRCHLPTSLASRCNPCCASSVDGPEPVP